MTCPTSGSPSRATSTVPSSVQKTTVDAKVIAHFGQTFSSAMLSVVAERSDAGVHEHVQRMPVTPALANLDVPHVGGGARDHGCVARLALANVEPAAEVRARREGEGAARLPLRLLPRQMLVIL